MPISGNNPINKGESLMGSFDKKYIIREAENILQQCNKKYINKASEKNKIINLKVINKKQKRKTMFWKFCSFTLATIVVIIALSK